MSITSSPDPVDNRKQAERWAHEAARETYPPLRSAAAEIAQAHALLAIGDELIELRQGLAQCGHGTIGFCPSCLQLAYGSR